MGLPALNLAALRSAMERTDRSAWIDALVATLLAVR